MNGKHYTNENESARVRFLMTVICIIAVIMVTVYFIGAQLRPPAEDDAPGAGTSQEKDGGAGTAAADKADGTERPGTDAEDTDFKFYISFSSFPETDRETDDTSSDDMIPTLQEPETDASTDDAGDDLSALVIHEHKWTLPTCTERSMCTICHIETGEPLGHDWAEATCTAPSTCKRCGEETGEPAGHDWTPATCIAPETCLSCGETRGDKADHNWKKATCTEPKTCTVCGIETGEALGHKWDAATCTSPEECSRCGKTRGEALGHKWSEATTSSPSKCLACGATKGDRLPNSIKVAAFNYTDDELDLLARLIYRETGTSSKDGMRAVATVVLNRVRYNGFGSTITAVITAPGQFTVNLDGVNAPDVCYEIARECLAGNLYDSDILYFKTSGGSKSWSGRTYCFTVGNNSFYS